MVAAFITAGEGDAVGIVTGAATAGLRVMVLMLTSAASRSAARSSFSNRQSIMLADHSVRAIGEVWLGDKVETDASFAGLVRVDRHLGATDQVADANLIAKTSCRCTTAHHGQGRACISVRLKISAEAFPTGPPNMAALIEGADTMLAPPRWRRRLVGQPGAVPSQVHHRQLRLAGALVGD